MILDATLRAMPHMHRLVGALVASAWLAQPQHGQETAIRLRDQVHAYRRANEGRILAEFVRLLSIPNHVSDADNLERNAQTIAAMLEQRGVSVRLLRVGGAPPVVHGHLETAGAELTVGIYAHYDGQAVDPTQWRHPPFEPWLEDARGNPVPWQDAHALDPEARIYARSASDDKAPIQAVLTALDALRATGTPLSVNIKFLFEGEEEPDSPHLAEILEAHPGVLDADVWLLCDGPIHPSGRQQVFFGARGELVLHMTVYGPIRALHSGHYGNWATNPIVLLSHLLAGMRDPSSRVLIPGFYDDVRPLSETERAAVEALPRIEPLLQAELGIAWPEGGGAPLARQILKPALNVIGVRAGYVGPQYTNVISAEAHASIDFRLVPNQTIPRVRERVEAYVSGQGYHLVSDAPDAETRRKYPRIAKLDWAHGYPGYRGAMDTPVARAVTGCVEAAVGGPVVKLVSVGAAVPMAFLQGRSRIPVIGLPIANPDNNQHAANENLRLQNLWDAIAIHAVILAELGNAPWAPTDRREPSPLRKDP
jgi:acetylornithine deacetylase/succinyl-diaminopimelate desuccinylase-like protein